MKSTIMNRIAFATVVSTALLFSGGYRASAQTIIPAKDNPAKDPVTKDQRERIELVVREYLLRNPSIIREAMQELQIREEREKQQRAAESLKNLKSDIYMDPDSPSVGNSNSNVPVVVFFDYNCGHCKNTLPALQSLLSNDPSLRIIYKEFPILGPSSQLASVAALAAKRQGKYAEFHHALMVSGEINIEVIKGISDNLKLDYAKLQKDMADPAINEALNRNMRLASTLGINGTPAYIVGDQIIPGAIDSDSLARIVAAERAKQSNTKTVGKDVGAMK